MWVNRESVNNVSDIDKKIMKVLHEIKTHLPSRARSLDGNNKFSWKLYFHFNWLKNVKETGVF